MPLLSIITITYNAEKFIERTIKSIENQSDKDFEYIIIDGNSTDNTLKIIDNYKNLITTLVTEKDKGLYDAMNKGLRLSMGDFVWFINAGDEISDKDFILKLKNQIPENTEVIYGDSYFVNELGIKRGLRSKISPHKLPLNLNWRQMKYGMLVCHQSFIAKRKTAPEYILDNLSADIDWEIKCLKNSAKNYFYPEPISNYLEGGISNQNLKKSLLDRFKVLVYHFGLVQTTISHIVITLRGIKLYLKNKGKYW